MLVSVCIPCYNAEKYVCAALTSILAQTYQPIEIIAVNDGSTDSSAVVLNQFAERGVRVIHQQNAGQCAAANRAWNEATGDYIKFFDADDIMHPQMVEKQMMRLAGSNSDIASAGWGRFYSDDHDSFTLSPQSVWRDMDARDWLVEAWMDARPMMQCALWLIPRRILQKTGGWDEELSLINDFEFFARVLSQAKNIRFTPDVPLMYRSGLPGSLSGRKSDAAIESAFHSLMRGTEHLLNVRNDSKAMHACANVLQDFIYTYYPCRVDLRKQIKNRVTDLGGSDRAPTGSPKFDLLRKFVGWKLARILQLLATAVQ